MLVLPLAAGLLLRRGRTKGRSRSSEHEDEVLVFRAVADVPQHACRLRTRQQHALRERTAPLTAVVHALAAACTAARPRMRCCSCGRCRHCCRDDARLCSCWSPGCAGPRRNVRASRGRETAVADGFAHACQLSARYVSSLLRALTRQHKLTAATSSQFVKTASGKATPCPNPAMNPAAATLPIAN